MCLVVNLDSVTQQVLDKAQSPHLGRGGMVPSPDGVGTERRKQSPQAWGPAHSAQDSHKEGPAVTAHCFGFVNFYFYNFSASVQVLSGLHP